MNSQGEGSTHSTNPQSNGAAAQHHHSQQKAIVIKPSSPLGGEGSSSSGKVSSSSEGPSQNPSPYTQTQEISNLTLGSSSSESPQSSGVVKKEPLAILREKNPWILNQLIKNKK